MNTKVNKLEAGKGLPPIDFDPFSKNAVEERKEVTAIRPFHYISFYQNSDDYDDISTLVHNGAQRAACVLCAERIVCCQTSFKSVHFNLNKF